MLKLQPIYYKRLVLFFFFFSMAVFAFSYEKVPVVLNFKDGGELHTFFYCFNDFSEGKKIAEEIFHVQKYDEFSRGAREKMIPVPLGTRVGLYDWAIFCRCEELWLFEVKNGWLWGRGILLSYPR